MTDRDWRETAYLSKLNWPDAIPPMGPRREYGVYPWGEPDDPEGIDEYPWSHPDAAGLGDTYMGDVCPMCGVPLRGDDRVRTRDGEAGELWDVSPDEKPVPCYHPECWREREAAIHGHENASLDDYAGGETA